MLHMCLFYSEGLRAGTEGTRAERKVFRWCTRQRTPKPNGVLDRTPKSNFWSCEYVRLHGKGRLRLRVEWRLPIDDFEIENSHVHCLEWISIITVTSGVQEEKSRMESQWLQKYKRKSLQCPSGITVSSEAQEEKPRMTQCNHSNLRSTGRA